MPLGVPLYLPLCIISAGLCPLISVFKQRFKREGCPNCEEYLHLQGSEEAVETCTSSVFEGLVAMADPSRSWVAKWQRIDGYVKGIYATKVMGQLPEEIITSLMEEYRIRYIPYVHAKKIIQHTTCLHIFFEARIHGFGGNKAGNSTKAMLTFYE